MAFFNILTSSLENHEYVFGAYPQLIDNTDPVYMIFLMLINIECYIFHAAKNLISLQGRIVQTIYSRFAQREERIDSRSRGVVLWLT